MKPGSPSFDGIHRDAADKTSAMVFAAGVHYQQKGKVTCPHWNTQPQVRRVPKNTTNLTGIKFGRFTVIGLHRTILGSWVVRCTCGDYETRKARSVLNTNNFGDRCHKCRRVAFERKDYEFWKNGVELDARLL